MARNARGGRRRSSRYLPPRPTIQTGDAAAGGPVVAQRGAGAPPAGTARDEARASRVAELESAFLASELWRVAGVVGVCLALLAVLVAIDRFG